MSVIPAAIDALVAMARSALPDDVQVMDGPEAVWPEKEYVAIGLSPDDLENPSTRTPAGKATTTDSAQVIGMIRVWSGGTSTAAIRPRAYELLDALIAATEADNRLGGAVDLAELTGHIYAPGASKRGRWVDLIPTWQVTKF
jgi:hypothetical protein